MQLASVPKLLTCSVSHHSVARDAQEKGRRILADLIPQSVSPGRFFVQSSKPSTRPRTHVLAPVSIRST